jgi:hypothetical protein
LNFFETVHSIKQFQKFELAFILTNSQWQRENTKHLIYTVIILRNQKDNHFSRNSRVMSKGVKLTAKWQLDAALLSRPVDLTALVSMSRSNPDSFLEENTLHRLIANLLNEKNSNKSDKVRSHHWNLCCSSFYVFFVCVRILSWTF